VGECTFAGVVRVLTWNLKHGRAVPSAGRDLFDEFAAALAGWEWDVALLQEVPPWWPARLGARLGAEWRRVLTSRNWGLGVRRAIAVRWPDAIKSNGGGSNAILVRGAGRIAEHRVARLCWLPERRWLQAVRLDDEIWVGNLHTAARAEQGVRAVAVLLDWAAGSPVVLGGDFNVRELVLPGLTRVAANDVDEVFVGAGVAADGAAAVLDRGRLSDHAPVLVSVVEKAP
jgi:endonuclease/exonuclease/phosphatase family metal-dependent hydrolase